MSYRYKFSIIIAVYNIQDYIEEAIESLITQRNIEFDNDIQVILVNDGSKDQSGEVCKEYRDKYPNNIIYIETENRGVSAARNEGLKYITGKYVNFLDGDDKLGEDVLGEVYDFFEQEYKYIDVVAIKMIFFEAQSGGHTLNYKFKEPRIVSILQDYKFIQLSSSSAFIKNESIKEKKFKEELKFLEDAYVMTEILLDKKCYGVLSTPTYFCRKRYSNTSATQNLTISKEWYLETLREFHLNILKYSEDRLGYIPKYVQYLVMYDLQWRIKQEVLEENILDKEAQQEYIGLIKQILSYIDDKIIKILPQFWIEHKLFCLNLKYKDILESTKIITKNDIKYVFKDEYIYKLSDLPCNLDFIYEKNQELIIEGFISDLKLINIEDIDLQVNIGGKQYIAEWREKNPTTTILNTPALIKQYFIIKLPIEDNINDCIKFKMSLNNIDIDLKLRMGKHLKFYKEIKNSYIQTKNMLLVYNNNNLYVLSKSLKTQLGREYRFIRGLIEKGHRKSALVRLLTYLIKTAKDILFNKPIWIFMDRIDKADDNAEALFKYLQKDDSIKTYFILNETSEDIQRVKSIGKVLKYNSIKQKLMMTLADKVISSHVDDHLINPLGGEGKYLASLCNYKFIFLQHGITKDNMSKLFNRYNKNIDLFITSGVKEYESIFQYDYYYEKDQVKLTGFPRHDYLTSNTRKQVVIMPTWRQGLTGGMDKATGKRGYNPYFKQSIYFEQYNKLINDENVINICKANGYEILFLPHPNMLQQIDDFDKNNYVKIMSENINYKQIINEGSLLITDYSSVAFDFGYLNKPVIYYQFDKEEVLNRDSHTYEKGYFEYDKMGFGPIVENYEEMAKRIKEIVGNECKINDTYKNRVNQFFKYVDKDNCKRVYEEIKKMK